MQGLLRDDAGLARELQRALQHVIGAQHAPGAQGLDALVVAVGGAAAVGDLAECAGGGLERHHGGIDVTDAADRAIDERARRRHYLHRLLAQEPACHVEIVDHHVPEQPAGHLDVVERRRAGVPAGDGEHLQAPDAALAELFLELREIRVEAPVETEHERNARLCRDVEAGLRALAVEIEWLLAEHRLLGARRRLDERGVSVGRARDEHGVDARVGERGRGIANRGAISLSQGLRRRAIHVHHGLEPSLRVLRDVAGVDLADASGAELAKADHEAALRL